MSSWFSEKAAQVNTWVNQGPRLAGMAVEKQRTADEQAAELETQARRAISSNAALELLSKWVDRIDNGHGTYQLPGSEPLSYHQVLLRSRAFEVFLDVCMRAPSIRQSLKGDADVDGGSMGRALRSVVERILLPGSLAIWPSLMEVFLASGHHNEGDENAAVLPPDARCGPWARRALLLLKRRWQDEALPSVLRSFDRRMAAVAGKHAAGKEMGDGANEQLLLPTLNRRMSKNGIRVALARDRLQRCTTEALRLRAHLDLACDVCSQLSTVASDSNQHGSRSAEVERLLEDADAMLESLDANVKERSAEQDQLKQRLGEVGAPIEEKIAEVQGTLNSFTEKRERLQEERGALARRLEELDMHMVQLEQAKAACQDEERQLRQKLRDSTNRYRDRISGSFIRQKRSAEEKTRAVSCKECAHMALDVIRGEEQRFGVEVAEQLRKRRAEVRRSCAQYVHQERLRFEAAVDCLEVSSPKASEPGEAGNEGASEEAASVAGIMAKAASIAEDAWRNAQQALKRSGPLVGDIDGVAGQARDAAPPSPPSAAGSGSEAAAQDAQSFFASKMQESQRCADCGLGDSDWASVSYGTYLCLDCAGKHRGLGVHVSFVRSTTMDKWSRDQLRRMQMGGTEKFMQFLKRYPQLYGPPQTLAALSERYHSRAATFYRRSLDSLCEGSSSGAGLGEPPPPEEGHLPTDPACLSSLAGAAVAAVSSTANPASESERSGDDEATVGTLEEERQCLTSSYRRHLHRLQAASSAAGLSSSFLSMDAPANGNDTINPAETATAGQHAAAPIHASHSQQAEPQLTVVPPASSPPTQRPVAVRSSVDQPESARLPTHVPGPTPVANMVEPSRAELVQDDQGSPTQQSRTEEVATSATISGSAQLSTLREQTAPDSQGSPTQQSRTEEVATSAAISGSAQLSTLREQTAPDSQGPISPSSDQMSVFS